MSDDQSTTDQPEVVAAAVTDGAYTLFVADFTDTDTAWEAYEALKSVEDGRTLEIDGVIVVKKEDDGKLEVHKATDHSTKHGLKWGLVGGVALGIIFPPSILGSAAVVGGAGAAIGKARQLHHRSELASRARGRHRARTLGHRGSGVRPRRGGDPQGPGHGRRHRRVRGRRRRGRGHQGGGQGGRVRGRLAVGHGRRREWSQPGLGLEPAGAHGVDQGLVVALVLVGVGGGEVGDGPVEGVAVAQVGGDGDPVAGAGVGAGQGRSADPGVERHHAWPAMVSTSAEPFQSRSWRR